MNYLIRGIVKLLARIFGEERILYHTASDFNKRILSLKNYGYLHDSGWIKSFIAKESISSEGKPIPWFSYPMIDFLESRLNKKMILFEYGSGNSTLYFKEFVEEIIAVESNLEWYNKISKLCHGNASVHYVPEVNRESYVKQCGIFGKKFDIIIVDGIYRNDCLSYCAEFLNDTGVIIADDTNSQSNYGDEIDKLMEVGFRRIDFFGISSFVITKKTTTLLYKKENCLGI